MAHRSSAPALHAARIILKSYDLAVIPPEQLPSGRVPNLRADFAHLSVIIDLATNIHLVAALRPKLYHWQEILREGIPSMRLAAQLAGFLDELEEAYAAMPKYTGGSKTTVTLETPSQFGGKPQVIVLTKPAMEVSRFIFHYYSVTPKKGLPDPELDRIRIAKLADVSLNINRTVQVPDIARNCKTRLLEGSATKEEVQQSFRALGILLEHLPNYEEREEVSKLLT
jgi:hypothetical protein